MHPFIAQALASLQRPTANPDLQEAFAHAAFTFEKWHGQPPCAWPDELLTVTLSSDDITALKDALIAHAPHELSAVWALGKLYDLTLIPLFISLLRQHLHTNREALWQLHIALDNLGQPVFRNGTSPMDLDPQTLQTTIENYLAKQSI